MAFRIRKPSQESFFALNAIPLYSYAIPLHPTRRVLLAEDPLAILAVHRPPASDAALQSSPRSGAQVGMPATEFLEDGDRPQAGRIFQQRDDFTVPDLGQGIGPAPFPARLLLAGKSGVFFKAIGGGRAETGLRAGNGRRMLATRVHE